MAPRQELDDCHRLSQTLRSENANLKDQVLVLRTQNQDLSERAVDDSRRLAQLESSNQQLETSVQAYQDERSRLEAAYQELRACLPASLRPLSSRQRSGVKTSRSRSGNGLESSVGPLSTPESDPEIKQADQSAARPEAETPSRSGKGDGVNKSWLPSRTDGATQDRGATSSMAKAPST
jgi:chromosome segregation ATPase